MDWLCVQDGCLRLWDVLVPQTLAFLPGNQGLGGFLGAAVEGLVARQNAEVCFLNYFLPVPGAQ